MGCAKSYKLRVCNSAVDAEQTIKSIGIDHLYRVSGSNVAQLPYNAYCVVSGCGTGVSNAS